jgi:hypothetical protein
MLKAVEQMSEVGPLARALALEEQLDGTDEGNRLLPVAGASQDEAFDPLHPFMPFTSARSLWSRW